jgi:TonB family protein
MRSLTVFCLFLTAPALAQDAVSLGTLSVSAVLDQYVIDTSARLPDTHQPLPMNGKWSIKTPRPDSCPHDDSPCARVVYSVPEAHVVCEWTVVPGQSGVPAAFLDQNEDASRYLLRKLPAAELAALVVKSPQPMYPAIARAARVSGPVVVRFVVSEKGTVTTATALSGPAMLRGAAVDAAQHWVFHPLQTGAQATPFTVDLNASFTLEAPPPSCTKSNPCGPPKGDATMLP